MPDRIPVSLIVVIIIVIVLGVLGCAAFESVPAGHVGVVSTFGAVNEGQSLPEGVSFVNPFADVIAVDCRIGAYTDTYTGASKDMQDVRVELTLNARLDSKGAAKIYKNIGTKVTETGVKDGSPTHTSEWFAKIVRPASQEVLKAELAKHSASDILANRSKIKESVQAGIIAWCVKYDVLISEVSLADIDFDPAYNKAIQEKQVQEQKALQKTYELQGAQKQAEVAKAEASGKADAAIETARGEAQAILTRADAEAKANKMIAESLSGPQGVMLLQIRQLEKWNGILPTVVAGDSGASMLLNIGTAK
jgi:regulator of protease activity HflC (stomatin/prohibitin superfamily)